MTIAKTSDPHATATNGSPRQSTSHSSAVSVDNSRLLSEAAVATYVVSQIVTQCSTATASMPQLPWQGIDMLGQSASIALAFLAIALNRKGAAQATLLGCMACALLCSASRAIDFRLVAGFFVIASIAREDMQRACKLHCSATLFAVTLLMTASLLGIISNPDFMPNGRIVFGYGFRHPNTLGGLLFSASGALTFSKWRKGSLALPLVLSGTCAVFSYIGLSSNAAAALCGSLLTINLIGIVFPACRSVKVPNTIAIISFIGIPALLFLVMTATASGYDSANGAFAFINRVTHARPYYSHEYFNAAGGFTLLGAPTIVRYGHHSGGAFWGIDSGYSQLTLVYGMAVTALAACTYAIASWKASRRGVDLATTAIVILCALYLVVEPFPLFLYSNFALLFLENAFEDEKR